METAADLATRGGRVRHVRFSLATRYGNVGLEKFGQLVAAEETRLTGKRVAAYAASTVLRWEKGSDLNLDAALAIASLGGVDVQWVAYGEMRAKKAPTPDQEGRTTVAGTVKSERPGQKKKKPS